MVSWSNLFLRLTTTGPSNSVDLEEEEEEEYFNKNIFNLFKLEDNYCACHTMQISHSTVIYIYICVCVYIYIYIHPSSLLCF